MKQLTAPRTPCAAGAEGPLSFSPVPRLWPGETVVILAGGASLTRDDVEFCRAKARVVAINDAYRLAPWADLFYACDARWWDVHFPRLADLPGFKVTHSGDAAARYGLSRVMGSAAPGLSADPALIHLGNNGGYQALNIATLMGATRILGLGYDMKGRHWFGDHPKQCSGPANFARWIENFATVPPDLARLGATFINCSRDTALTCFPRATIEEALGGGGKSVPLRSAI